jgi:hypothetical protein
MARRSAFDTTFSMQVIGMRWLTPERLSIFLSARARNAISSTTSRIYFGTTTLRPPSRINHASCPVIAIPSSAVAG